MLTIFENLFHCNNNFGGRREAKSSFTSFPAEAFKFYLNPLLGLKTFVQVTIPGDGSALGGSVNLLAAVRPSTNELGGLW